MPSATNEFSFHVPNLWSFDDWAHFQMRVSAPHQMPTLDPVASLPCGASLTPFDKRLQSTRSNHEIVHFFIDDSRFRSVLVNPATSTASLSEFAAVIGPDVSPYASHTGFMRATSIWYSKAISAFWQVHGLKVIPNIRWVEDSDLDFALCGVPSKSILALSTLGVSRTRQQRSCLRRGIKRIITEKNPTKIVVHGINREDIFGEFHELTNFDFHNPRIYEAYAETRPSNG